MSFDGQNASKMSELIYAILAKVTVCGHNKQPNKQPLWFSTWRVDRTNRKVVARKLYIHVQNLVSENVWNTGAVLSVQGQVLCRDTVKGSLGPRGSSRCYYR